MQKFLQGLSTRRSCLRGKACEIPSHNGATFCCKNQANSAQLPKRRTEIPISMTSLTTLSTLDCNNSISPTQSFFSHSNGAYYFYQMDSWWYYKGINGGVKLWEPRPDVFPYVYPHDSLFFLFRFSGSFALKTKPKKKIQKWNEIQQQLSSRSPQSILLSRQQVSAISLFW